jgi:hypothetical protein
MTRSAALAMGIGALFAGAHLAYLVLFYVAGSRVGIWSPATVDVSKGLSGSNQRWRSGRGRLHPRCRCWH